MPLEITFTLSDRDWSRLKTLAHKTRNTSTGGQSNTDAERAAYKSFLVAMNTELPDFIDDRVLQLKVLLDMLKDSE